MGSIADPQWVGDRVKGGLSSGEGLINEVRDERREWNNKTGCEEIVDSGVKDKRRPAATAGKPHTLAWALERYRSSSAWATLSNATRRQRENIFRQMVEQKQPSGGLAGDVLLRQITAETIRAAARAPRRNATRRKQLFQVDAGVLHMGG